MVSGSGTYRRSGAGGRCREQKAERAARCFGAGENERDCLGLQPTPCLAQRRLHYSCGEGNVHEVLPTPCSLRYEDFLCISQLSAEC
jgi:hypothetical protein